MPTAAKITSVSYSTCAPASTRSIYGRMVAKPLLAHDLDDRPSLNVARFSSEHLRVGTADEHVSQVAAAPGDHEGRVVDQTMALPELLFCLDLCGNVERDTAHANRCARCIVEDARVRLHPHRPSIFRQPPEAIGVRVPFRERRRRDGAGAFAVVRVHDGQPEIWCAEPLLDGIPEHRLDVGRHEVDPLLTRVGPPVCFPDDAGNTRNDRARAWLHVRVWTCPAPRLL